MYQIPPSDYIDKCTGYPHPEEHEKQYVERRDKHLREYENKHYGAKKK